MSHFRICPSGTIMPFGGTNAPPGWLFCDGSSRSRLLFKKLFDAIGTNWGPGDNADSFNLPDLRGLFFRGLDINASGFANRDPNRDSRTALQGGVVGNRVGSYQGHGMASHKHSATGSSNEITTSHGHSLTYETPSDGAHTHSASATGHAGEHKHAVTFPFWADLSRGNGGDNQNQWEGARNYERTSTGHEHKHDVTWAYDGGTSHIHYLPNADVSHQHEDNSSTSGVVQNASTSDLDIYPSNAYVNFIIKI